MPCRSILDCRSRYQNISGPVAEVSSDFTTGLGQGLQQLLQVYLVGRMLQVKRNE
jgi:hypothetical protein